MKNKEVMIGLLVFVTLLTLPILLAVYYAPPPIPQAPCFYMWDDGFMVSDQWWSANYSMREMELDYTNETYIHGEIYILNSKKIFKIGNGNNTQKYYGTIDELRLSNKSTSFNGSLDYIDVSNKSQKTEEEYLIEHDWIISGVDSYGYTWYKLVETNEK